MVMVMVNCDGDGDGGNVRMMMTMVEMSTCPSGMRVAFKSSNIAVYGFTVTTSPR